MQNYSSLDIGKEIRNSDRCQREVKHCESVIDWKGVEQLQWYTCKMDALSFYGSKQLAKYVINEKNA
jgi:hypothetical protein